MDELAQREVGDFLRQGEWFGRLAPALQDWILRAGVLRTYRRGQMFQVEGSPPAGVTAVLEGRVLLLLHPGDEDPALIHVGGPDFWLGIIDVLLGDRHLASVVAHTPVRALLLPKAAFDRIGREEPSAFAAFAGVVFERYRILMRFLAEARRLGPDERLRVRLADLADLRRVEVRVTGRAVVLDLTQAELASMVGLSRPKLSARLRALQNEGWVELRSRRIRVLDADGLRATALGPASAGASARRAS